MFFAKKTINITNTLGTLLVISCPQTERKAYTSAQLAHNDFCMCIGKLVLKIECNNYQLFFNEETFDRKKLGYTNLLSDLSNTHESSKPVNSQVPSTIKIY